MKKEGMFMGWLGVFVSGFFLFFFLIYAGRYGLTNFILKGGSTHETLANVGIWYVLIMFVLKEFCGSLSETKIFEYLSKIIKKKKKTK